MKKCDLCETDNPDEARFCNKCGRDLDKVSHSEIPDEMLEQSDTFTPIEDDEFSRLAPTRRIDRGPVGDVASYKEAAAASAAAWEAEQEQAAIQERAADDRRSAKDALRAATPAPEQAKREIQQRDLHADFSETKKFCVRCGMANPRDQRFCKNCGSALVQKTEGMADMTYDTATPVPLDTIVTEKTTLADVSPSSAYSVGEEPASGRVRSPRRSREYSHRPEFGVRELVALIIAALVLAVLIWFFAFGGYTALFDTKVKNISKAGSVMEKMPGFQYAIAAAFEAPSSEYPGSGHVLHEAPGSSAWEIHFGDPAGARLQGTLQVSSTTYTSNGTWQAADPKTSTGDVTLLWKNASSVVALPNAPAGAVANCLHYKYTTDPELMMTVLGLAGQKDVSEAVMETWIDPTSFQVIRETAQVFGALINGARTHVTFVMDLTETGKTYGIKPPG